MTSSRAGPLDLYLHAIYACTYKNALPRQPTILAGILSFNTEETKLDVHSLPSNPQWMLLLYLLL